MRETVLENDGSFHYDATNLNPGMDYYYVACAMVYDRYYYGEIKHFSTAKDSDYGEAVDLGLSVKWRSCNIGAANPEDFGAYYGWGETTTKTDYSWSTPYL